MASHEQTRATNHNRTSGHTPEEAGAKWGALAGHVEALRSNEGIAQLPEHDQGRTITDRFVGALVAGQTRGLLVDSHGQSLASTKDILSQISQAANTVAEDRNAAIRQTVRGGSVRVSAGMLLEDDRTSTFLGDLNNRVAENEQGAVTMRSAEQVVGYTEAVANGVYKPWQQPILDEVGRCVAQNHPEPNPKWSTYTEYSEVPIVQADRNQWRGITEAAQADGIDFTMLTRSLSQIQEEVRGGNQFAGVIAAEPVTPEPNYDHLFRQ